MANYELLGKLSLKNILDKFEKNLLPQINCVKMGKIVSFDSSKQMADVSIDEFPTLQGVPVHFPKGSDFSIQLPVKTGDDCIVLFCDTDLDNWVEGKGSTPAFSEDIHGLNGAVALVGVSNSSTKISDYTTDGLKIKYGNNDIKIDSTGITLTVGTTILQVTALGVNITGNLTVTGMIGAASLSAGGVSLSGDKMTAPSIEIGDGATGTFTDTGAGASQTTLTITKGVITNIS